MISSAKTRARTAIILISTVLILHYLPPIFFSFLLAAILGYILYYEWPRLCPSSGYACALTLVYPILPFTLMIYMQQQYHLLFMAMLTLVATFDTGAYITGSLLGRHRLFARISPGKTWEGTAGGLLCALAVALFITWYHALSHTYIHVCIATILLCIAAVIGDLFESWLKRRAGVKDSADILPGHGGFLDRFDSHMGAVFVIFMLRNSL